MAAARRRNAYRRGRRSEMLAAWWLRLKGYRILARGVRSGVGEIDILAVRGRVLAVGPGKLRDSGERSAVAVSKGDEVLYGRYSGTDIEVDRKEIKILRESDILAKVVK